MGEYLLGILILNAALQSTLAAVRTSGLNAALPIEYAPSRTNRAGTTFVETGNDLVVLLRASGWPLGQEIRVQWSTTPMAPAAVVSQVRTALMQATLAGVSVHGGNGAQQGMGARAYAGGSMLVSSAGPAGQLSAHEATHVVQQGGKRTP